MLYISKQKIAEWLILLLIITVGVIYIIWFNSHFIPLPTRLPDGKIALSQDDFNATGAEALKPHRPMDHWSYLAMSEKPFSHDERVRFQPHCWRILTPLIVHFIPLPRESAFYLLAIAGILISAIFLYLFLRNLFSKSELAYYGVITFFLLNLTSASPMYRYTYLEATTLPFFFIGLYCIDRKKYLPLIICLYLGVLQREILLFLGPTLLVYELVEGRRSLRHIMEIILLYIAMPFLIIAAVHGLLPTSQGYGVPTAIKYFWEVFYKEKLSGSPIKVLSFLYIYCVEQWGIPGFFITTFGLAKTLKFFTSKWHYLVFAGLVYSGLILGPNPDRYLCYAAPLIIACYVYCIMELFESTWLKGLMFTVLSVFQLLWNLNRIFPYLRNYHLQVRHLFLVCALIVAGGIINSIVRRRTASVHL